MISFCEQAGGLCMGLNNFPQQAAQKSGSRRCLTAHWR